MPITAKTRNALLAALALEEECRKLEKLADDAEHAYHKARNAWQSKINDLLHDLSPDSSSDTLPRFVRVDDKVYAVVNLPADRPGQSKRAIRPGYIREITIE